MANKKHLKMFSLSSVQVCYSIGYFYTKNRHNNLDNLTIFNKWDYYVRM